MKARFNKFLTLLAVLLFGFGQVWGDVTLFTADFSAAAWDGVTFSQGNTDNYDVINGITFHSKNSSKQFSISGGVLTWPNNNMSSNNYYLGFPVTGINEGSITISVWDGSTATRVKYLVKNNEDAFSANIGSSGTNTNSASPTTVTVSSLGTKAFVYLGRQGSGLTTITKIVVTTPNPSCAAGDPGNISKGTLVGGELTLTVTGSPASGDTWYWQAAEDGTSKTNDAASISVDAAGTYYIRSYNTAGDCWSDAKSITVNATDLVENYTVVYKDGTDELGSEVVAVGSHPAGITDPTKDCYTFAGWSPALSTVSGTSGETVEVSATWTANYFTTSVDFEEGGASAVSGVASKNIVASVAGEYDGGKESENWAYKGWKIKSNAATVKVLVQANKKLTFKLGYLDATAHVAISGDENNYSVTGASKVQDDPLKFTTYSWTKNYDALYTFTTGSAAAAVIKALTVQDTYTATRVDGKSDGAGSDANVLETTLPTPTAISGWTFTGWTANEDVKLAEETKTAGTLLAAGTYTLLANTTFTAQWVEASATYDITYVSAHGTAPGADNAASVVLAEITGVEGWAHKGWTADVDVTVDAATVDAGDLIANGKTAILASDVTFTAVWNQIFEVEFNTNGGSEVAKQYIENGGHPEAVIAPTKTDYVFVGWFNNSDLAPEHAVADITALTISDNTTLYAKWALDIQITELVFSNSFKAWINGSTVTVFYMEGESAPTITSYAGTNLKATDAVAIVGDEVVATGSDDSEKHYTLTMTAVTPLTTTGAKQTFDGSETYVKTPHAWTDSKKWKMSKYATDGRVARGECSLYFFVGPAESVTFDWGAQKVTDDVAVYVNGTFVKNIGKNNNSAIPLTGGNNMVAFYTLQTSGDIWVTDLTLAPYVPTTAVVLKEGGVAISEKEIWESTDFTLTAEVTPDNASDKTITWTSSNEAVATVVGGVVTGVAADASPVTITATTVDGITATCAVTVTAAPEPSAAPTITTQPADGNYYEEATIDALEVVATGESLTYQWQKKVGTEWENIASAEAASYTPTVSAIGSYEFRCIVTNTEAGKLPTSLNSDAATITISEDPAAIKLLDGSTVNHTNFITGVTAEKVTISEVEYDCVKFSGTVSGVNGVKDLTRVIAYNATTNQTKIKLSLYNTSTSSRTVQVKGLVEGADAAVDLAAIELGNKEQKVSDWIEFNNAANRTIYIFIPSSAGDVRFLQVKVIESGATPMKQAGEIGYAINLNKGRLFGPKETALAFEGFDLELSSDYQPINTTYAKIKESSISFTVAAPMLLSVTTSNNKTYYVTKGSAGTDNETAKTGVSEFDLTAGTWFITGGTSEVQITNIAFSAPKCAEPAFNALANSDLCEGAAFVALDGTATVADAGVPTYQWYNADGDVEIDGATSATYTPTADGSYYVIATNHLVGYTDNTKQSATVTVTHFASVVITETPKNVRDDVGAAATLTVAATGKNLSYQWYTCDDVIGTNPVEIPGETNASLTINVTAGLNQYYKVVVSSDCGASLSAVAKIEEWTELPQVTVDASTTWDWVYAATATITPTKNVEILMANIKDGDKKMTNDATFNSQALLFYGQESYIVDGTRAFAKGGYIKFTTTVAGIVEVEFSDNGNNNRRLSINGHLSESSASKTDVKTFAAYVPAGEVKLMGVNPDGTGTNQYIRISKIVFTVKAGPDYTRDDTWMAPGELGTVCYPEGLVAVGAHMYKMAGTDANNKFVFDEVEMLEPGVPYLFVATANAIQFYATTAAAAAEAGTSNGMVGTFTEIIIPQASPNKYYFSGTKFYAVTARTTDLTVPANRAYVDLTTPHPAAAPKPGARRITFDVQGENSAQGFENLQSGDAPMKVMIDGTLYILRGEKVFDATGRLVK